MMILFKGIICASETFIANDEDIEITYSWL